VKKKGHLARDEGGRPKVYKGWERSPCLMGWGRIREALAPYD
jgi:hypothetical protein